MRHHTKKLTLLLALCATMALAGPAWGQSTQSGDDGYRNGGEDIAGELQGGQQGGNGTAGDEVADTSGGSLPFTGLDVALIFGVGGLLMAVGLGTRRLTRHPDAA
jgi:hypothetical protein